MSEFSGEIRYSDPPQSRNEAILKSILDVIEYNDPPQSRIEDLLLQLKEVIEHGGGGSTGILYGTSAPTAQQGSNGNLYVQYTEGTGGASDTVDALFVKLDNEWCEIETGGSGGTTDYNDLQNKPQINSVELSGNKSLDDLGIQSKNLTATASGSIATFANGGDDIPVSEFECEIVAQQASGTPTPSSPLPITGHSQSDIAVSGKNLFGGSYNVLYPLFIKNGTEVTASIKAHSGNLTVINYYRKDQTRIDYWSISNSIQSGTRQARSFTITEDAYYFSFTNEQAEDMQIELGSDISTFEAYKGNLYTVSFGQTIYGGRLIYANGQWSIEATHGYTTINDCIASRTTSYDNPVFYGSITGLKNVSANIKCEDFNVISGKASASSFASASNNYDFAMNSANTGSSIQVFLRCDEYSDVTSLKNAVGSSLVVYELATPVIIPITSSTRVKTISGDNNIYSNTGDCELKYFTNKADSLAELVEAEIASTSADYHEYSTTEQIVGKWIDGRTVYEKTMNVGAIGSGTTFAHGITNLDWIIDYSLFGLYAGENKLVSPANGSSSSIGFVISSWDSTNITFTKGNLSSNFTDCYCTIRYIKSTSNTRSLNLSKGVEEKTEEIKTEEVKEEEK